MTVYWVFEPRTGLQAGGALEFAPNLAVPSSAFQKRVKDKASRVYYDGVVRLPKQQAVEDFPSADGSARMLVWRRRATDPVPALTEPPDEVWTLSSGGRVIRHSSVPANKG
ncbi:hypothetical protein [Streptomyces lavendulae]|uniref:hypothetical protein n=1 Tax=Streptomyces lavendulae TaxID=1914 RepID=UPI0024A3B125|nr:hypothetical protein [Streptomyces lavendulae]GLX22406.1 hypothetical protein Slala01_60500 [Streptomyces lavendulae subsp. lavendulae]GLX29890.1 hypothetical protein Slala02_57100 [Streptomyces lavendulae subsp. lavendulae]